MIVIDTNVLVALTDRDDRHHRTCRNWLTATNDRLLIPPTVLAEACYLIDRELGPETEAVFLDDVGTTDDYPYQLIDLVDADCRRQWACQTKCVSRGPDRVPGS